MRVLLLMAAAGCLWRPSPARAQLPVENGLAQIDRTFVCPESLPNDAARDAAMQLFIEQVRAVQPNLTVAELVSYRMTLLQRHDCAETLAHIAHQPRPSQPPRGRGNRP